MRGIDSGIGFLANTWLNTYDFIFSGIGIGSGIGSEAYTWLNTRNKSQYLYYMKYLSSSLIQEWTYQTVSGIKGTSKIETECLGNDFEVGQLGVNHMMK